MAAASACRRVDLGVDAHLQHRRALVAARSWSSNSSPASASALEVWRSVGAVCFDVDSTVCEDEGIDVLAEHCGAGEAVKAWTTKCVTAQVADGELVN